MITGVPVIGDRTQAYPVHVILLSWLLSLSIKKPIHQNVVNNSYQGGLFSAWRISRKWQIDLYELLGESQPLISGSK